MKKAFKSFAAVLALAIFALSFQSSALAQSNKSLVLSGNNCSATAATLAITASGLRRAAAGNGGVQFWTVDNAGGTLTVNCLIDVAQRLGSSARITSVEFMYGAQATAPTAIAAMVVSKVTHATPGAAAAGTVSSAGGSLTVVPTVLQLTATTSGQCYNEKVSFGTPIAKIDGQTITLEHVVTFGAATGTFEICGIQVNYTDVP